MQNVCIPGLLVAKIIGKIEGLDTLPAIRTITLETRVVEHDHVWNTQYSTFSNANKWK